MLKKGVGGGVSLIFILTNPFQRYLSECLVCVRVCFVHLHHFYQYYLFHRENLVL